LQISSSITKKKSEQKQMNKYMCQHAGRRSPIQDKVLSLPHSSHHSTALLLLLLHSTRLKRTQQVLPDTEHPTLATHREILSCPLCFDYQTRIFFFFFLLSKCSSNSNRHFIIFFSPIQNKKFSMLFCFTI